MFLIDMDQHPVPRNITGFQFQLIGFMTLKQFSYLVVGFIFAFIFYKAPLSVLKIPLAAFSLFLAFAFAFLPIQERPLEIWIKNFIKSVCSPTQFIYQKEEVIPSYLKKTVFDPSKKKNQEIALPEVHQEAKEKLQKYLSSVSAKEKSVLDAKEENFLKKIAPLLAQSRSIKQAFFSKPVLTQSSNLLPKGIILGVAKLKNIGLPGILINVINEKGEVVRILKTDQFGKFESRIPLPSGKYQVSIEDTAKKTLFDNFNFMVNGQGLAPWLIKAKT